MLDQDPVDEVRHPDEVGHEAVDGLLVELGRAALLLDPAQVHDDDRVAHRQGLLLVVGHVDERDPDLALECLSSSCISCAELAVERAQRLVEEQHRRMVDERPGQGDALLLAAGQLPRAPPLVAGQSHELQRLADPARLVGLRWPAFWRRP